MNFPAVSLSKYLHQVEKLTIDNSPAILTALGVAGTVTTAYLTGKATFKAAQIIEDAQRREDMNVTGHDLVRNEKIGLVWKEYIIPAGTGVFTVTAIIGANRVSTKRAAAMAAAYAISEGKISEYKEKVTEKLGINKEQKVRDEIAQDRLDRNPPSQGSVVITGNGDVLCMDQFSGRYFKCDMETLKRAQNDTNYQILREDYASVSDFYERIGLPPTSFSEEVGWTSAGDQLELLFSSVIHEGRPVITFDFNASPIRGFNHCE